MLHNPLTLADIGCGAGFPSLVLALAFPSWKIFAIDSAGKKTRFVESASQALQLKQITVVNRRSNELNHLAEYRKRFDIVTARAVAESPRLYRDNRDFPMEKGCFIFYKTPEQAAEELPELQKSAKKRHWSISENFQLPGNAGCRCFVIGK